MTKKNTEKVRFSIVTSDQEGPKETEWKRNAVILYPYDIDPTIELSHDSGNAKVFIPYSASPDNRLVSGSAFKRGKAIAILDDRPYVDVDFLIHTFEKLKKEKDVELFRIIKANVLKAQKNEGIKTDTK